LLLALRHLHRAPELHAGFVDADDRDLVVPVAKRWFVCGPDISSSGDTSVAG
jgi:hypothetical protein